MVVQGSVFGPAPLPERVCNVWMERVSAGESVGYAIISNGFWLGTLTGEAARAFRDKLVALPHGAAYAFLLGVAKDMAAGLNGGRKGGQLGGTS